jgi:heme/copper-type cytochrome/quinol oxidase subunit 2
MRAAKRLQFWHPGQGGLPFVVQSPQMPRPFAHLRVAPGRVEGQTRHILLFVALAAGAATAQDQGPTAKPFSVGVHRFAFEPARIEVNQNDLVKIDLHTDDIAHSLTIDEYRIAKRVEPAHPVTFEFRADRAGTFRYYCNLQIEDGCRQMHGELVVRPRK